MPHSISLENLGIAIKQKRGSRGIREVAKEIGISTATLSRIENGKLPDIETFSKACKWLEIDGGKVLGCVKEESASPGGSIPSFHLKTDRNPSKETATALAEMILAAHKMFAN
ncbi:MAG: helix-turn-helix transcriptional regulator [Candidatus Omnitrophica bacterium]|nr:helix-turn-helix transcriptional regulator [Candidatus Omnitrophota bacterium]